MKPIVMLQSERAEYEIKLISERFEEAAERMKRKMREAESELQEVENELREARKEKNLHSERNENAIRKLVEKDYLAGLSRKEAKDNIQDIFSLQEEEAEEKMGKYWVQEGEK